MEKGEIILYQPNETIKLEVRIEEESVWLTQAQMAELFQTTKQNISLHTNNIFKEGELDKLSVVKDSLTTASDGKNYRIKYYKTLKGIGTAFIPSTIPKPSSHFRLQH